VVDSVGLFVISAAPAALSDDAEKNDADGGSKNNVEISTAAAFAAMAKSTDLLLLLLLVLNRKDAITASTAALVLDFLSSSAL